MLDRAERLARNSLFSITIRFSRAAAKTDTAEFHARTGEKQYAANKRDTTARSKAFVFCSCAFVFFCTWLSEHAGPHSPPRSRPKYILIYQFLGRGAHRRISGWNSGGRMASGEGGSVPSGAKVPDMTYNVFGGTLSLTQSTKVKI